ncbi:hypothetical protein TYRP_004533 [Tyrophagus putrescentiae]|nr:hypothetical protein TYRP_004533 [Tyrophagus putrescentiae]
MPKFPNSHFYGGKTTFGGANLRKNIRRLQTTPYSALSNVRSIEAKPATVNGKLSSAALNGDSHLSSRTKRVLECLELTALPVSNCQPASTPSFGTTTQPPTLPSAQPTPFKFGQSSNSSVASSNTGFNFSQTLPSFGQPASTPSFGAVTQPAALPSVQPSLFTFGQSSNNATAAAAPAANSGFNFGQAAVAPVGQSSAATPFGGLFRSFQHSTTSGSTTCDPCFWLNGSFSTSCCATG